MGQINRWASSSGILAYVLGCNIVVSEFELQYRYYVHFRTNVPRERDEPSYNPTPLSWVE